MAKRYSIAEARSNLPTIVDQAESGQEIELTRLRGARTSFGASYKQFLETHVLSDVGLDEPFFVVSRETTAGRPVAL